MLFTSLDFLMFFPVVLFIYFIFPARFRYIWLLAASYYFYMSWNPLYAFILTPVILIGFLGGIILGKGSDNNKRKKGILIICILMMIGVLAYFKYSGFAADTVNLCLRLLRLPLWEPRFDIILPVGISFYTLQTIGYLIDVYRGDIKSERNPARYALFIAFFPQILSGPINRAGGLLKQMQNIPALKLWDYQRITSGFTMMLWGYFVKLVIADRIAVLVDNVFDNYYLYGAVALIAGAFGFAIQIYSDFGSYSLIAIGAAKVLGFELTANFAAPYFAQGIGEFWRRWHISLSSWLKDYVYIPLGGNRRGKWIKYRNLMITFGVSGLWHGANWTFVIWGLLHGGYSVLESELRPLVKRINQRLGTKTASFGYRLGKIILTFILVDLAWIFFRADSVKTAFAYIAQMISYHDWWSLFDGSLYNLGLDYREFHIFLFGLTLLIAVDWLQWKKNMTIDVFLKEQWIVFRWAFILMLIFTALIFGQYGSGFDSAEFIYLQF